LTEIQNEVGQIFPVVKQVTQFIENIVKARAWRAWIGYSKTQLGLPLSKFATVANSYSSEVLYLEKPPPVTSRFIQRTGLSSIRDSFSINNNLEEE